MVKKRRRKKETTLADLIQGGLVIFSLSTYLLRKIKANEGWVVTNSTFTDAATKLATSTTIRLIDRNALIKIMVNDKIIQNQR